MCISSWDSSLKNCTHTQLLLFSTSALEYVKDTSILTGLKLNFLSSYANLLSLQPALFWLHFFQFIQPKTLGSSWFFAFSSTLHPGCQQILFLYLESCLPNKSKSSTPFPTSSATTFVQVSRTSYLDYCSGFSFLLPWLSFNFLST